MEVEIQSVKHQITLNQRPLCISKEIQSHILRRCNSSGRKTIVNWIQATFNLCHVTNA